MSALGAQARDSTHGRGLDVTVLVNAKTAASTVINSGCTCQRNTCERSGSIAVRHAFSFNWIPTYIQLYARCGTRSRTPSQGQSFGVYTFIASGVTVELAKHATWIQT